DAKWTKIKFIIRSWIFSTLAPSLRKRLVDLNPTTAKDAWTYIAVIFQDNKRPLAMALKAELRNLKLGDLSIDGYFQKIESIVSVLNGLGSPLSNDDVVTFALEGLTSTYETIYAVIVSREHFPNLKMVRSLLTTHEMRLKSRVQNPLVDATSASPMVLLAKSNTSARRGPSLKKVNNPCGSFAKGSCRFGDAYKYLHNGVHSKSTLLPRTSGSASSVPDVTRSDLDMLQSMLAKFGSNAPNTFTPSPPVAYTVSVPPGPISDAVTAAWGLLSTSRGSDAFWSTTGGSLCTWTVTAASSVYDRGSIAAKGFFPCNDDVVTFALEGLPSTYETIYVLIVSREPFPDLKMVRSLLTTHEMRLKSRVQNPLVDATSASPLVLLAKSNTSTQRGPSLKKVNNPCWSFAKGSCWFGDACKYLHNGVHGKSTLLPRTSSSASSVPDVTRSDLDMLQSLLAKFGLNAPNTFTPSPPVAYTVSVPPGFPSGVHFVPGPSQPPVQFTTGVQQHQGGSFPGSVHLGQSPSMPFHPIQLFVSGSQGSGQATLFSNAFNTTTLQDLASGNWNMDTCASSHLNDSVHCLSDILNMCIYPSVAVGDGRFIPFVRYNSCTVEFDPFGFSVKDFITRRVLLRCDSTGDFYPVTKPSTIPHAFLSS
nr:hybrid signal transduction histidine kinase M [Tanacetum cinerariifolium]